MKWAVVAAVLLLPAVAAGAGSARPVDATAQVYSIDVRTGRMTRLAEGRDPAFAPRGGLIAFGCSPVAVCVMRPNGSGRRTLAGFPGFFSVRDPAWSPDGSKVAFTAVRPCEVASCTIYSVYVVEGDRSGLHQIASSARAASWSPDSRRLVFEAGIDFDGVSHELRTARSDGTPLRRVAQGNGVWEPRWSPSGTAIAYSEGVFVESFDDNRRVRVHSLTTGRRRLLGRGHDPSWSSHGSIAFTRSWPRAGLYVASPHGWAVRRIATDALRPAWSPDGSRIAYWHRLDLMIASASGKHKRVLTRLTNVEEGPGSQPSWSPDATTILFAGTA
jgi:Tol biopolymer transport system component